MDKYEVYVSVKDQHREMFRIRVNEVNEIVDEVNSRYEGKEIIECTACKLKENFERDYTYFSINEGKISL